MRILKQSVTFEVENKSELGSILKDYQENGWKYRLGEFSINPINNKTNVTVDFINLVQVLFIM